MGLKSNGLGCFFAMNGLLTALILASVGLVSKVRAQDTSETTIATNTLNSEAVDEQLAALGLERTNAVNHVLAIVNRPVRAYARTGNMEVSQYVGGWFHPGANKPDFDHVDVRQSQETKYQHYVCSDLNPNLVFLGQDLEFNANLKYFYINRSLPKARLTEAQMLEINKQYRIIGRCDHEILHLKHPPIPKDSNAPVEPKDEMEVVVPGQKFEGIRKIPKETRILYGGIAIGGLVVMVVLLRLIRRKPR